MESKEERLERIQRVTQEAWNTFHATPEIAEVSKQFYEEALKFADKEFWSGQWCNIPYNEKEQVYWLQQYWMFISVKILEKIKEKK